jgi:hypothetical protein
MSRLASWLLLGTVLAGAVFIAATSGALPPRVATHFGAGGSANGWMPRDGYAWTMGVVQVVLPFALFGALGHLPKRAERYVNLPHRDYWLAPERRAATVAALRGHGAAMGIVTALLLIGVHAAILDANSRVPPRLDEPVFIGGLAAFVVALLAISASLFRKFRRVPGRH